jgi:hypothetical protein
LSEIITLEINTGTKLKPEVIGALLRALSKISPQYHWGYDVEKQRWSYNTIIRLTGQDGEYAASAIIEFTSYLGVKTQRR